MKTITIGQRLPLEQIAITDSSIMTLKVIRQSSIEIDISCFALDAAGKLISDDYMVFYNQPNSPCGALKITQYDSAVNPNKAPLAEFDVHLVALPASIDSLFFVLSADTPLNQLQSLDIGILQGGQKAAMSYQGSDFANQRASMLVQIYRKGGVWRLSNVAQGFDGGLDSIVKHFGGDVEDAAADNTQSNVMETPFSLEKIMLTKAPKLVNLAKKATISLEKRQLQNLTAKVALVLDASGSMNGQYNRGAVQEVVDRILPLGVSFDDNQMVDCWAFGAKPCSLGEIGLHNYENFVTTADGGWKKWKVGSRINNEADMIDMVTKFYQKDGLDVPVYVLFISDGGVHDNKGITRKITDAAKLPIFWQFVGLGGSDYGVLKRLDDLQGRVVDNCNFFEVDNLHDISEEQLYENMLEEFPTWLKEVKRLGILNP